ncbi:MAG TPA: LamG domain-containing protein [Verrucomicrobiae bacterium]
MELRDGSRVVGTSVEKSFRFHSALLGGIKLDVKDIRAVEWGSTNSAKLTTVNGDTLTVSLLGSGLEIKTGFGKVELAVDSMRKLTVTTGSIGKNDIGLVAHFAFDGSSEDTSGNGLNGSDHEITYSTGVVGTAAIFNGRGSFISVPDAPALNLTGPFTLAAWFRFDFGGTWNPRIFHKGNSYQIYTVGLGSVRNLAFSCTAGGVTGATVPAGQWTHVVGVFDGTTVRLYVNGQLVGQAPASGSIEVNDHDLTIGRNAEQETDFLKGAIDEARIYNRALLPDEIKAIYNDQK